MFNNSELDTSFAEIQTQFSGFARQLFPLPPYAEVSNNLVSMANYLPLIHDLLEEIDPEVVCEIGAYRGITTNALLGIADDLDYQLHVVDPAIDDSNETPRITRFKMLSTEYLSADRGASVFFIDGDHNFFTVHLELELIENMVMHRPSVIFLHDVSWPCARRDMYYLPETIPESEQHEWDRDFDLSFLSSGKGNRGLPFDLPCAVREGGDSNGVLSAVESFLLKHSDWQYMQLPSIYGLGILWCPTILSDDQQKAFDRKKDQFNWLSPFVATLELNRLQLLSEINRAGKEWGKCQTAIAYQADVLARARRKLAKVGWLGKLLAKLLGLSG